MSKWVETAMRPVPERSHMLKTCPTKAGPPPFPFVLSLVTLTDLAAGRECSAAAAEEEESTVGVERGGAKKRGREIAEGGCGCDFVRVKGEEGIGGLKREAKLEAVVSRNEEMGLLLRRRR